MIILRTWRELHALLEFVGVSAEPSGFGPRYNLAPTQPIPIVRRWGEIEIARWGLVHRDEHDRRGGPAGINVRAETLVRPSYRALRGQRCLVVVDGFYEWSQKTTPKVPHLFALPDGAPMVMGGVYEEVVDEDGVLRPACAIVTVPARGVVAPLHERMPLLLASGDREAWVRDAGSVERILASSATAAIGGLTARPVSQRLGSVRNDDASLLEPEPPKPSAQRRLFD